MLIEVTVNGETTEVDIDPDLSKFTLQETVRLEEALGEAVFDRLMGAAQGEDFELPTRPSILQAILWAKLASLYPTLGRFDFDLDLAELGSVLESTGSPGGVVLPMSVGNETIVAEVEAPKQGNG